MIDIKTYFEDAITKEDRRVKYTNEFKPEYEDNANKLLEKVNALMKELGVDPSEVTSGWRPASVNGKVTNAAKRSSHMIGEAVDIKDNKNQDLAKLVASKPELLRKYGLWLESPDHTRGVNTNWCHIDCHQRTDRPSRVFIP